MMRKIALLAALLLAACQLAAPEGAGPGGGGLAVEEISVTSLDAPEAAVAQEEGAAEPDGLVPEGEASDGEAATEEAAVPQLSVAPEVPDVPKSPEQLLCEQSGGLWTVAGETGANLCVSPMRDAGKACRRKGDCDGECLARSGTCSPYAPLFGCNDVLDKDGRQVTLCLD